MATYQIPSPKPMNCTGDVASNWAIFKEAYTDFAIATELNVKNEVIRVAALKALMGDECKKILASLALSEEERKCEKTILDALETHFKPTRNVLYERYIFHIAEQQPNETVDNFVIRLKQLVEPCKFGSLQEEMIRDRLVLGCRDGAARIRLFREKDVELQKAVEQLRISEATQEQLKKMCQGDKQEEVNYVQKSIKEEKRGQKQTGRNLRRGEERAKSEDRGWKMKKMPCRYCGSSHRRGRDFCKAYGKTCSTCGRMNHFREVCMQETKTAQQKVHSVQTDSSSESTDELYRIENVGTISNKADKQYFAPITIKRKERDIVIRCQLDTGATCNVMSDTDYYRLRNKGDPPLHPSTAQLKMYDERLVKVIGECNIQCEYGKKQDKLNFKVIKGRHNPLLSGETCLKWGLITIHAIGSVTYKNTAEQIIAEYDDVFQGLGCLPGEYHITIDKAIPPVQHAPRRVPAPLKEKLKRHIGQLEKKGIITKVTEPTQWISSMVTVTKPGKVRICIDPKDLNRAILRPKYQMPTLEEVLPRLANAKVFTVLDAKDGFHQVKLDEESSFLTTFWTPFGRYRYLRMPFGISSAPEEYQRRQHEAIMDLPGVEVIADDILIFGSGNTPEEYVTDHNKNLRLVLERAKKINLKLNKDKTRLLLDQVPYMGHLLTNKGIRPDPEKIRAIQEMPRPGDKKAVQRLLGCVNFISRHIPNVSDICEPMRRLTNKDVQFHWQSQQEEAFQQIKKVITSVPVLKYYDLNKEVTIQCDASEKGLGAVMLQDDQPVAFASRALTITEQCYAQIEKECLSILFACTRFNQYIHGRETITVDTDHKPLIPIFKKALYTAPKRLQRMLLKLQKYCLQVKYRPGNRMHIADMLSRAFLPTPVEEDAPEYYVYQLAQDNVIAKEIEEVSASEYLRVSDTSQKLIQQYTKEDASFLNLMKTVMKGWPETKEATPVNIRQYWMYRDEITAHNGILYKGQRVIVPKELRKQMLKRIHASHLGPVACVSRAREVLFWPGMSAEIKEMVGRCDTCNEFRSKQAKETLVSYEIPSRPWKMVGQDIFNYKENNYLVTVDYFSDFWEVDTLEDLTAKTVIEFTKAHFARHGIPDKVVTDNGTQYTSKEFADFAREWEFKHITSSPYHSQSNGKAESAVKIAKRLMKKAAKDNNDFYLAILDWRNAKKPEDNYSPAQKLMSRRTRTLLPTSEALLLPKTAEGVADSIKLRKLRMKKCYDKSAHDLPPLNVGDTVRIQPRDMKEPWKKAICTGQVAPRSYTVRTENGNIYRRNRRALQSTKEETQCKELLVPGGEERKTKKSPALGQGEDELGPVNPLEVQGPINEEATLVALPTTTRSGRVSKPSKYFEDFVKS